MRVPEDISVVGFHIPGISDLHYPVFTSIEQPFDFLAEKAVEQLERLMATGVPTKPKTISIDNKIWLGQSVGAVSSTVNDI